MHLHITRILVPSSQVSCAVWSWYVMVWGGHERTTHRAGTCEALSTCVRQYSCCSSAASLSPVSRTRAESINTHVYERRSIISEDLPQELDLEDSFPKVGENF